MISTFQLLWREAENLRNFENDTVNPLIRHTLFYPLDRYSAL